MAKVLSHEGVELDELLERGIDFYTDDRETAWANDEFRSTAAHQLELWLSGMGRERPSFFSENEGRLLKVLYGNPEDRESVTALLLPKDELEGQLYDLEVKVRLFLGLSPIAERRRPFLIINSHPSLGPATLFPQPRVTHVLDFRSPQSRSSSRRLERAEKPPSSLKIRFRLLIPCGSRFCP
jgi:hypothetical protein